ncbi:MAG: UbiD family decarboxylase [Armatimonadota bacterium]
MAWHDFRHFLQGLETEGQLRRISQEVDPEFEIAAYIRRASDTQGPAFLFERVKGHPGWSVAAGVYGTYRRLELALGTDMRSVVDRFGQAIRSPLAPVTVNDGPVKAVALRGDDIDCTTLPLVRHSEHDAGRYITSGVAMALDPETRVLGLGIQRIQLKGPRRFGISLPAERRIARAHAKAEDRGEALPIAIAIGAGPYVDLASQAKIPHDEAKLGVAGALAGAPIELVRCETCDVLVPARAEMVIEGRILPKVREPEGPFGEVGGTYGLLGDRHVLEVTAITMRRDAIYQTVLTGMPTTENHVMAWPAVTESATRLAKQACPEVRDVHAIGPYYVIIVSIKKRLEGEARNVILSVLGPTAGAPQAKWVIVVDEDIDVRNWDEVLWAMYTRVQPDRDVMIFPPMVGAPLDPSAPIYRHSSKIGIDATIPMGADRERFRRVIVPGADDVTW